jgi:hypothetical protein
MQAAGGGCPQPGQIWGAPMALEIDPGSPGTSTVQPIAPCCLPTSDIFSPRHSHISKNISLPVKKSLAHFEWKDTSIIEFETLFVT